MTWDRYWNDNKFTIPTYKRLLQEVQYPLPVFHLMGNHDNDPTIANDDFAAAGPFRQIIGPTDFSFNIGNVHYILLDIAHLGRRRSMGVHLVRFA